MLETVSRGNLDRLPIFPLPEMVLFPHTLIPLHIFEPRYRKLTADVLRDDLALALAHIREGEYGPTGAPAVYPVAGVGRVVEHRKLPDGRYYLLLKGIGRVQIEEELETPEPYRLVRARVLEDFPGQDDAQQRALLTTLHGFVLSLAPTQPRLAAALSELFQATRDPEVITSVIASMTVEGALERQRLLENRSGIDRLQSVTAALAMLLNDGSSSSDPGTLLN